MEKGLISVIVPIYNVEAYLSKCIESILNQTFENLELLLVNDGSPDNSADVCMKYLEADARVKYFEKPNGGISDARNYGIDHSLGEYIAFIDSDDYISPHYLDTMYKQIILSGADICICNFLRFSDGSKPDFVKEADERLPITGENLDAFDILAVVASNAPNKYKYITVCNKLYHIKLFNGLRFEAGKFHEDEVIFHKIFSHPWEGSCTNEVLYFYLYREGSITQSKYSPTRLDGVEALLDRMYLYRDMHWFSFYPSTIQQCISIICEARTNLDVRAPNIRDDWRIAKKRYNSLISFVFHSTPVFPIAVIYLLAYISPKTTQMIKTIALRGRRKPKGTTNG